jgi:hypothetical protein
MPVCRHCGTAITIGEPIPRDAECTGCGKDIRACIQCRHYDPALNNACRETEADPVVEKERRNFCEYFSLSTASWQPKAASSRESDARARLEGLFGGKSATRSSESARKKLEDLFRKPGPSD